MTKFLLAVDNYIITKTILQLCISILTLFVEDLMKDIDFEKIGKKLKEIRLSKGLPQDAVAGAAEVKTFSDDDKERILRIIRALK